MAGISIRALRVGTLEHVDLAGTLDISTTDPVRRVLCARAATGRHDMALHCADATFVDCSALGVFVQLHRQLRASARMLWVTGVSGLGLSVLEIAGVAKSLGVHDVAPALPGGWDGAQVLITDSSLAAGPGSDEIDADAALEPAAEAAEFPARAPRDELTRSLLDMLTQLPPEAPERGRLRSQVVERCAPFAVTLARRFVDCGEPFDDLRQVAMVGLLKAVDGYDPARGRDFLAYAAPTVLGELRRYFRDKSWRLTVPRRHKDARIMINSVYATLAQRLGRWPSVADVAGHLGIGVRDVLDALEAAQAYRPDSLQSPISDDRGNPLLLMDRVGAVDPGLDAVEYRESLGPLIAGLPPREQRILAMRFYGNMTQAQIADRIGLSQMHVSRLLSHALGQLRAGLLG